MALQLRKIQKLHGELELLSGLRIGASEGEIRIGGVDNQVIRHPYTDETLYPGIEPQGQSAQPTRMAERRSASRSLYPTKKLSEAQLVRPILQLFGVGGGDRAYRGASRRLGTDAARLLGRAIHRKMAQRDRARQSSMGRGQNREPHRPHPGRRRDPRQSERVPAGATFDFTVSIKVLNIDADDGGELRRVLYRGLRLLELDSLGGSGSRGYGKVKFRDLRLDGEPVQAEFEALDPFSA